MLMEIEQEKAQRRALGVKALGLFNPDEVPGLKDAQKEENFFWDSAFLGLSEKICGFYVKPLTVRHLIYLQTVNSPFLLRAPMELFLELPGIANHMQRFMWIVSTGFNPTSSFRRELFYLFYRAFFVRNPAPQAILEICEYINEAFADLIKTGHPQSSYCSVAASCIDLLAHEYGWPLEKCMDTPLKIIFQLSQCIRERNGKRPPKHSDRLLAEWLEGENRKLRERN